jgi:hypothetical protein
MIKRTTILIMAIVVSVATLSGVPAGAQISANPIWHDTPHHYHQWLFQIMKDMIYQMDRMAEQMSRSYLTPDERQQMAQRMGRMGMMMRRISGLVARPALKEADWQTQMNQMRKQMDEMMRDARMPPHG